MTHNNDDVHVAVLVHSSSNSYAHFASGLGILAGGATTGMVERNFETWQQGEP